MLVLLFLLLIFSSVTAVAQQQPLPPDLEPVPDGPPAGAVDADPDTLPEVTIRRLTDAVIREYRINDRLYMVQVVPVRGLPYFLLDTDGNGSLETRYNDLDDGLMIPGWVILSW